MLLSLILFILEVLLAYVYPFYASLSLVSDNNIEKLNSGEAGRWCAYWISVALLQKLFLPILGYFDGEGVVIVTIIRLVLLVGLAFFGSKFVYLKIAENQSKITGLRESVRGVLRNQADNLQKKLAAKTK